MHSELMRAVYSRFKSAMWWSGVELLCMLIMHLCLCVRCSVFVPCLRWMRACRAVWTGRCRSGSCVCWGSAAWPASSPCRSSGSASCSGPPPLAFAVGGGMDNSLLSPLCQRTGEVERCYHQGIAKTFCFLFLVHIK